MRRFIVNGLGVALLLGVAGCGGGGIEEGVPKSTTPDVPLTVKTEMPKGLNPKALPKGADAPAPTPEK